MNCPSRTDPEVPPDWNQSPNALSGDSTTRSDLSRIASARLQHDHKLKDRHGPHVELNTFHPPTDTGGERRNSLRSARTGDGERGEAMLEDTVGFGYSEEEPSNNDPSIPLWRRALRRAGRVLWKYAKFVGPGFMISVAYIDPGNYATDVSAGASYRFKLLFMILVSNLFAIFLQSLCIKLGSVTGLTLAENCRAHLPSWLNYVLYAFAEAAIIATDIAEVIGTATALNLLLHIPIVAGCAISICDVLFILLFYSPDGGSMRALRAFEYFVMLLVLGVVICFCFQLSLIKNATVGEVFKGYLPSSALVQGQGLYQACGILGATVMPHSLYLGSGIIQARLKDFDNKHPARNASVTTGRPSHEHNEDVDDGYEEKYRPSISAIRSCLSYSIAELAISLFTFALFVNSAILIVAGASLYNVDGASDADLFGIHTLLSQTLAPAAATIFALALLLSGISAGIVCTIAGQMVSEGQLRIAVKPWVRRLMTRSISIIPSIVIAGAVGKEGLSNALNASQVALSVILPFVSAPLIYFTCRNKFMTVGTFTGTAATGTGNANGQRTGSGEVPQGQDGVEEAPPRINVPAAPSEHAVASVHSVESVQMKNGWITTILALLIWGIIVVMNVALLVLLGLGKGG
jgi:metal iron transporter